MSFSPTGRTGFFSHSSSLAHDTGRGHPESPKRLLAIDDYLQRIGMLSSLQSVVPHRYDGVEQWITRVHRSDYYQGLQRKGVGEGLLYLDPDTPFSKNTLVAAEMAVSGLLTAIDQVMAGLLQNAFCAFRPPGHHAESNRAMGFCLFNTVAIGARYLQEKYHLKRIFIIDWDVHHGNGTQHCFYEDPDVFYFSTHQYPFYPGTGSEDERGAGEGEGATLNCPLEEGEGDREILHYFNHQLVDAVSEFKPDFILISAGFDAHREDPLASLNVTDEGFLEMTRVVNGLSLTYCGGRIVSCLEGGYHLSALARSVGKHLEGLSGGA